MHHRSRAHWPITDNEECSPPKRKLGKVIERNIKAIDKYRLETERSKSLQDHIADLITRWSGSMPFICLHVVWFALWIGVNEGWLGVAPFYPFPFGLLTTIVSLGAIFLSMTTSLRSSKRT